ncbi:MAG: class I tRNA ligase family protein [Acidimicrobiales bacterium]
MASDLVGARYQRPITVLPLDATGTGSTGQRVVAGDFVTTDDGPGSCTWLRLRRGRRPGGSGRGLPVLNPVDEDGAFDHTVPAFTGRFVKTPTTTSSPTSTAWPAGGRAGLRARYPHCWRCGTPLIYWAKTSWFARTSECRAALLRENDTIGWHPEHLKHGRFGKWLEGNVDWALSRDRYWGTPLPVWRCSDCGHDTCIGSVAELSDRAGTDLSELDLHRPYVDDVTFVCRETPAGERPCRGTARRLAPVLDAWFDSGSMPSAQRHHPFDDPEGFAEVYPADFICEASDQTRGWFYALLAVNTLVFDAAPYRNVVCLGHIVDEDGQKMSKSKGNSLDPWEMFSTFGADALRWYFFASGQPWTNRRVNDDGIRESTRQTLITLWHVFSFHTTYADLAGWSSRPGASLSAEGDPTASAHTVDRWVLAELDDAVGLVTAALDGFDALGAAGRLARFVDDLSNWYVRRSRPRFWKSSEPAAHQTLQECLVTVATLMAPFCPFLADELYTTLTGEASVHLADWPQSLGRADAAASGRMAAARRLASLGRAARLDAKVPVRQPLGRALLLHPGVVLEGAERAEIASELNVKELQDVDTLSGLITWVVVPNFRVLGPRLGSRVDAVKRALADADGSALRHRFETQGFVEVAGERLGSGDVEFRAERHESFALAEDQGWAVALDLDLTDELRAEGLARALVRVVNDLRKADGLAIADRITLTVGGDAAVIAAVETHRDWIAGEILSIDVRVGPGDRPVDLAGHATTLTITPA